MRWQDFIHQDPDIMSGQPVFRDTRLPVAMILSQLGAGSTQQELLEAYPTLRPEHFPAAFKYGAAVIDLDETLFVDIDRDAA